MKRGLAAGWVTSISRANCCTRASGLLVLYGACEVSAFGGPTSRANLLRARQWTFSVMRSMRSQCLRRDINMPEDWQIMTWAECKQLRLFANSWSCHQAYTACNRPLVFPWVSAWSGMYLKFDSYLNYDLETRSRISRSDCFTSVLLSQRRTHIFQDF